MYQSIVILVMFFPQDSECKEITKDSGTSQNTQDKGTACTEHSTSLGNEIEKYKVQFSSSEPPGNEIEQEEEVKAVTHSAAATEDNTQPVMDEKSAGIDPTHRISPREGCLYCITNVCIRICFIASFHLQSFQSPIFMLKYIRMKWELIWRE
jgi:hypothetical protein